MDIHIKMGFATYFPEEDVIIKIQWFEQQNMLTLAINGSFYLLWY